MIPGKTHPRFGEAKQKIQDNDGTCEVCALDDRPLHVDFDEDGAIRGILCTFCRLAARVLDRDGGRAQALGQYLRGTP